MVRVLFSLPWLLAFLLVHRRSRVVGVAVEPLILLGIWVYGGLSYEVGFEGLEVQLVALAIAFLGVFLFLKLFGLVETRLTNVATLLAYVCLALVMWFVVKEACINVPTIDNIRPHLRRSFVLVVAIISVGVWIFYRVKSSSLLISFIVVLAGFSYLENRGSFEVYPFFFFASSFATYLLARYTYIVWRAKGLKERVTSFFLLYCCSGLSC